MLPPDPTKSCLCPDCLTQATGKAIEARLDQLSHEQALELAASQPRCKPPREHIDYTLEGGYLVFTRWHLLQRGDCCGEKCRNCPYPED